MACLGIHSLQQAVDRGYSAVLERLIRQDAKDSSGALLYWRCGIWVLCHPRKVAIAGQKTLNRLIQQELYSSFYLCAAIEDFAGRPHSQSSSFRYSLDSVLDPCQNYVFPGGLRVGQR